jgi:hypothetical protein
MDLKTIITLMLGLVFQLAQVLPGAVVSMAPGLPAVSSCDCCSGPDSCPCAENEEFPPEQAPLVPPSGNVVKSPAAKANDSRVNISSLAEIHQSAMVATSPLSGPLNGYAGIRLSVAFCSFVI